jgi:hypothetical protein
MGSLCRSLARSPPRSLRAPLRQVILAAIVLASHRFLLHVGRELLRPLEPYPKLQLLLVMIVVPLVLTVFSFWIQVRARRAYRARGVCLHMLPAWLRRLTD